MPQALMVEVLTSPFNEDDDLPWEYQPDRFVDWVVEVLFEGYKRDVDRPTLEQAIREAESRGYTLRVHWESEGMNLKLILMQLGNNLVTQRGFDPASTTHCGEHQRSTHPIKVFTDWLNETSEAIDELRLLGVEWPTAQEYPTVWARREPTTDPEQPKAFDTVCYRDEECTDPIGRFPWHFHKNSVPQPEDETVQLNCAIFRLRWADPVSHQGD
jgi:hypothetical protein